MKYTHSYRNKHYKMESQKEKKIAIVGAGISGLLACKHLMAKGFNPMVFEAHDHIGGVWSSTISSTKLQTPKEYFQFSDFPWPDSVQDTFPSHNQVLDYLKAYANHFDILSKVKFNCRVVNIDLLSPVDEDWDAWGGTGEAFSPQGKWKVVVEDVLKPMEPFKVYEVDFVILCVGKFSDLPNIPDFPTRKGENAFTGEVIHSMDYGAMDKIQARNFIEDKRVTVVGFHKSALDIAAEIARINGTRHPCTLLFRRVHWTGSEKLVQFTFRNLNRFSELMIHKPGEGLILWLLAVLLSPLVIPLPCFVLELRRIFSKLVECYLRWIYPLKKYNMVPNHTFLRQIYSCMFMVLPEGFYKSVEEGSLMLKKFRKCCFCETGLFVDDETNALKTDVVIFATGYKSDQKISNVFSSTRFKSFIIHSSAPFYRECIHPRIPHLAILGYPESPATLFTFEVRSKWLACFIQGKFRLPKIIEMEDNVDKWERNSFRYAGEDYKRACVGVLLQIHYNDQLCQDMGCDAKRKKGIFQELFSPYRPTNYVTL